MTLSVKMREGTCVFYPNNPHSVGSNEVGTLLPIVNKKRQWSKKQIPIGHAKIWSLFSEKLCALKNKFDLKFDESRQILKKFDYKFEENPKQF
jgi:hypothetical protein